MKIENIENILKNNENSLENRSKNDSKIDPNIIMKADSQNVEFLLPIEARSFKNEVPATLKSIRIC